MNTNTISKYHVLFIGLIALTAFSHSSAMQKEGAGTESTRSQPIAKKRVALLLMVTVAAMSEGAQAEHFMGRVWREVIHKEVAFSECESGRLGCWRGQEFVKEYDGTWTIREPYFAEEKVWHCHCIPPVKKAKKEKPSQLIVLPQTQSYDNATCPVPECQTFSHHNTICRVPHKVAYDNATCPVPQNVSNYNAIRPVRQKVVYNNATCPVPKHQKFPLQKRNRARDQQRGGKKRR